MTSGGYVQNELIECNRLTSQESITGNNENAATWTNVLGDIYHLAPGDKVSMFSSFISEKGAGAAKTIEIKGQNLDTEKEFKYVELTTDTTEFSNLPIEQVYEEKTENIMLRDDEANLIINYYTNVNGTGYVGLPRAFMSRVDNASYNTPVNWIWNNTDAAAYGWLSKSGYPKYQVWNDTYYSPNGGAIEKIKNDNQKFTIFMVDATKLGIANDTMVNANSDLSDPVSHWTMAPEYRQYYLYREKHNIKIPAGFNSAEFIASDVTRQLQKIQKETPIIFRNDTTQIEYDNDGADSIISKTLSTTTYKPFSCAISHLYDETNFQQADINVASPYYNNYQTIGIKRAELYETGCKINRSLTLINASNDTAIVDNRLAGAYNMLEYDPAAFPENGLVLTLEYNDENLAVLKDFIDAQEMYPEIWNSFDGVNYAPQTYSTDSGYDYRQTINNTRFLHINPCPNASQIEIDPAGQTDQWVIDRTSLGTSQYRPNHLTGVIQSYRYSQFLLMYRNEEYKNKYFDKPKKSNNTLTYGCFGKTTINILGYNGVGNVNKDFITIYPDNAATNLAINAEVLVDGVIEVNRKMGYDMHWSALTTCAVVLFNGKSIYPNYYSQEASDQFTYPNYAGGALNIRDNAVMSPYYRQRYVGADNPTLGWDGEHFFLSDLHTPENLGNRMPNGARMTETSFTTILNPQKGFQTSVSEGDAKNIVYKINPFQDINEFCPALLPYIPQRSWHTTDLKTQFLNHFNPNYTAYTIYDSLSGIFIEDFGYDADTWESGLWGLLGFTYAQLNSSTNNRTTRTTNTNITDLKYATTNADVIASDTKSWVTNDNSIQLYTDNIPSPQVVYSYNSSGAYDGAGGLNDVQIFPQIVQATTSVKIPAILYPTSMIKGYYTIRSDIVPDSIFVGGKSNITNMPIIGMVDKMNPQSDYYFGSESSIDFTILKETRLSSISVSINDPDGSYANVNNSSAIVFKVQRQMKNSFNIAQEILQEDTGKKKGKL